MKEFAFLAIEVRSQATSPFL